MFALADLLTYDNCGNALILSLGSHKQHSENNSELASSRKRSSPIVFPNS
jgi:hypothetical protein